MNWISGHNFTHKLSLNDAHIKFHSCKLNFVILLNITLTVTPSRFNKIHVFDILISLVNCKLTFKSIGLNLMRIVSQLNYILVYTRDIQCLLL